MLPPTKITPEQAIFIKPVNLAPLRHFLDTNIHDTIEYVKTPLKMSKSEESNETKMFRTPQEPVEETQHTPIQKQRFQELISLEKFD